MILDRLIMLYFQLSDAVRDQLDKTDARIERKLRERRKGK